MPVFLQDQVSVAHRWDLYQPYPLDACFSLAERIGAGDAAEVWYPNGEECPPECTTWGADVDDW